MKYILNIVRSAECELDNLQPTIHTRISTKLVKLEANPRPSGSKKLHNTNYFRIRIGDYRVIYSINDSLKRIVILAIGHRKDIYRKL